MHGGEDGTRNSALAARRADSGNYSVVAVLRSLTAIDPLSLRKSGSVIARRGLFCRVRLLKSAGGARIFAKIPISPASSGSSGAKQRAKQQSEPAHNLGPGQLGQCSKSAVV